MYWPAKVLKHTSEGYEVQYDNGDKEMVLSENVSPFNPPFKFGEEGCALQVGLLFVAVITPLYSHADRQSVSMFSGQTPAVLTFRLTAQRMFELKLGRAAAFA